MSFQQYQKIISGALRAWDSDNVVGVLPLAVCHTTSPELQWQADLLPHPQWSGIRIAIERGVWRGRQPPPGRARAGPAQTVRHHDAREGPASEGAQTWSWGPSSLAVGTHWCARGEDHRYAQDLSSRGLWKNEISTFSKHFNQFHNFFSVFQRRNHYFNVVVAVHNETNIFELFNILKHFYYISPYFNKTFQHSNV